VVGAVTTDVGTIDGVSDVRVDASATEIAIVTNGKYYICDGTTTTEYATGSVTSPVDVAFLDGYFCVIGTATARKDALTVSGIDDGTTFGALDYVFAESSPDDLVGIVADHGELWLNGTKSTEIFYNSGAASFPFQRNAGARIERGCRNGATLTKADNSVFWVSEDGEVLRSSGIAPQVISTREVEESLLGNGIDRAFVFKDRGHKFLAVSTISGPTWCYDMTTGMWTEFSTGVNHGRWIAQCAYWLDGVQYIGTTTGKVCTQAGYNDDGSVIRTEIISIPIVRGGEYFSVNKIHANFNTGDTDIGRTPKVALQMSDDGVTWGNEDWSDLGGLGEHMARVTWHGKGAFRWAQARIWITDEVSRDFIGGAYQ
jgi:hypothetical protein